MVLPNIWIRAIVIQVPKQDAHVEFCPMLPCRAGQSHVHYPRSLHTCSGQCGLSDAYGQSSTGGGGGQGRGVGDPSRHAPECSVVCTGADILY